MSDDIDWYVALISELERKIHCTDRSHCASVLWTECTPRSLETQDDIPCECLAGQRQHPAEREVGERSSHLLLVAFIQVGRSS